METVIKRYNRSNVLITGGTGFIGLNLIGALKHSSARITAAFFKKHKFGAEEKALLSGTTLKQLDIRDRDAVEKAVRGRDYIFHLAAHSGAVDSMKEPLLDMEVNCGGGLNLLEACRLHNPGAVLLSLGSRLQFGRPEYLPVDEAHPLIPTSVHGVNKMVVEKYFLLYHQIYGLKTIYLRVTNPYGPYQRKEFRNFGIVNLFIQQALNGETINIFGRGRQLRDYIYIDDLIDAMLRAPLIQKAYGGIFNIGSGQGIGLIDMVKNIIKVTGRGSFKKRPWPKEFKKVETGDFVADISRAKKFLRWRPRVGIEEGLRKTIEAYL